jgi:hypothetical protein
MHTCDEGVERKKDRYKMMGEERRELKTWRAKEWLWKVLRALLEDLQKNRVPEKVDSRRLSYLIWRSKNIWQTHFSKNRKRCLER